MKFSELPVGRYPAQIVDWSLQEVEKLNNQIKVVIKVAITHDSNVVEWNYDGFLETKEGTPNKKTIKTLLSSGFKSDDIMTLTTNASALDTQKPMEVTISKNDKGHNYIEWLNSAGGKALDKKPIKRKVSGQIKTALGAALREKGVKKEVKNYAPTQGPADTIEDEIPF